MNKKWIDYTSNMNINVNTAAQLMATIVTSMLYEREMVKATKSNEEWKKQKKVNIFTQLPLFINTW